MKVVSLFTGAGGLDLGLKQAGHEVILQCEHDPGAQQVLRQNFPGVLLVNDVCGLQSLPKDAELLAAGFPCIDISRAGLRRGFQGQSSGLVRHVFRLLEDAINNHHPVPWILLENVEALLDRGPGGFPFVKSIVDSLECLGYQSWAQRVVCSAGFGVPNRRTRVFVLASLHGDARDILLAQGPQACTGSCCALEDGLSSMCYECYQEALDGMMVTDCSFALDLGNARSAPGVDVVPTFTTSNDRICLLLSSARIGMLRIEDAERLQGFPAGFTRPCYPIQPPGLGSHKIRPVKDSEADVWESKRYALLGNAVTVQVARWIGERLAGLYAHKYVPCDRDRPIIQEFRNQHDRSTPKSDTFLYGCDLGEFEGFEGGLLVRANKNAKPAVNCFDTGTDSNSDEGGAAELVIPGDQQDEAIKMEQYGKSDSQRDAWPRAAWFVRGMGRYGVDGMSENPIKLPFEPLGRFITQVGKLPGPDAINTYIMRLREQGWHVEGIVKKATKCGISLEREVSRVVRLEGTPDDPDQISRLVWTKCPVNKIWWPAEMLDPFSLPPGRSLPTNAVEKLTAEQKRQWLPEELWDESDEALQTQNGKGNVASSSDKECEDPGKSEIGVTNTDEKVRVDEGVQPEGEEKSEIDGTSEEGESRKVLVVYFGDNCHNWVNSMDLLEFSEYLDVKENEAQKLNANGLLKCPNLFFRAMEEAKTWLTVKTRKRTRGMKYSSAVSARAATLAAAENRRPRCGNCEACLRRHTGGLQRRCLTVRAHAAAVGGHVGAQLAIHGEKAIGASVQVYWPLDQAWYTGTITDYDRIRLRHTICYDDGDREIIPLWSPCQLVRVLSRPKEWQAKANKIKKQQQQEQEQKRLRKLQKKEAAQVADVPASQYEIEREHLIQRNRQMLDAIVTTPDIEKHTDSKEIDTATPGGPSSNTRSTRRCVSNVHHTPEQEKNKEGETNSSHTDVAVSKICSESDRGSGEGDAKAEFATPTVGSKRGRVEELDTEESQRPTTKPIPLTNVVDEME